MTEPGPLTRGTYTFLFTDIEGSTGLEGRIGRDRYGDLLERHRTFSERRGRHMAGSSRAPRATRSSSSSPRRRRRSRRPSRASGRSRPSRGRTTPDPRPDGHQLGCRGAERGDLRRTQHQPGGADRRCRPRRPDPGVRLTRDLLSDHPVDGVRLVDLGEHRLKDLTAPVRILEIVGDGLPSAFPPLRTLDARPNNLPMQLTSFVGRDAELDETAGLLATTRLLTLTGPGGTGKTRLSLQLAARAAEDFPDGVFFVPLEPIRDPMLVAPRSPPCSGSPREDTRPISETVADWLRDKRLLLVLDNFEQVIAAAPVVADLLRGAPDIKVIVSSRAVLHVSGEQEYPVPGLPAPPDPSQMGGIERLNVAGETGIIDPIALGQYAAVRLFVERAVSVRPGFAVTNDNAPAVAAIGARLHGMPLAIELAAARIKLLSPEAILVRLDQQLDVLAAARATCPRASRRSAAPSPGATTCSTTAAGVCSTGCRSSGAAAISPRRRRSAGRPPTSARTSSTG